MMKTGGRTQNKKVWLGGGAVVAVAIVLLGWFVVVNPQLSAALSTRSDTESARAQNVVLEAKNAKLKAENDNVAALRASLATALAQLPSDGGLPEFTRQVSKQASDNKVALTSVTVGGATAVAGAASATATNAAAAATTTAAATTAAAAAASSTGVVQIAITLSATGLGSNAMKFLKAVQVTGPRRALVTASQLAPSGTGASGGIDGPCTLSLTLTIFSAPLTPTAQAALTKLLSGK